VPPGPNQACHLVRGDGLAQEITLDLPTPFASQDISLPLVLDAFGERFHAKRICQRGDGTNHGVSTNDWLIFSLSKGNERK
jgi:hypothetical protein